MKKAAYYLSFLLYLFRSHRVPIKDKKI